MRPPRVERSGNWFGRDRWILPAVALALAPKCLACALAYASLAAALGFGGPELCGANAAPMPGWPWLLLGVLSGMILLAYRCCARRAAITAAA